MWHRGLPRLGKNIVQSLAWSCEVKELESTGTMDQDKSKQ